MESTIKLLVWGQRACFTRPDLKAERVTYECLTPSAARGILECIHWKPAISWVIDKIHVLHPFEYESIRVNEVKSKTSHDKAVAAMKSGKSDGFINDITDSSNRVMRSSLILRHVAYVIEAHFDMTDKAGERDSAGKHKDIFVRRALNGKCFQQPSLGLRDFSAGFQLIEQTPPSAHWGYDRDLGLMLYDIDYQRKRPIFFRARMENGVLDIAAAREEGLIQ